MPAIVIGTAAPAAVKSPGHVGPAELQLVSVVQGGGAGYQEFGPVVHYAGPVVDAQDPGATAIRYIFTLPKDAFDGGVAVDGRRSDAHTWSATVEDTGLDWTYSVTLTGPVLGADPEPPVSIRFPYLEAGLRYAGSLCATHDNGVPVLGTPVALVGTTGESVAE